LPYRIAKTGSLELLLVTTRQTKRWIIPKGWPVKGLKPAKSAAREAYEEAGIRGAISAKPIGSFSYEKRLEANGFTVPCEVQVFALSVRRQLKRWPEACERDSRWFEPLHALSALKDEGLRELIASFVATTTGRPCKIEHARKVCRPDATCLERNAAAPRALTAGSSPDPLADRFDR
jgi:8-oxo-dGTP pyrophosphatase MutT (NUDIX family)